MNCRSLIALGHLVGALSSLAIAQPTRIYLANDDHTDFRLIPPIVIFGDEWDLYSASMSETSARVKRAVEKLRAAELLVAFVSLKDPGFLNPYIEARDRAFMDLGLYWEHNWTADGPVGRTARAAWQEAVASSYKVFEILTGEGTAPIEAPATVSGEGGSTFENASLKLVLDRDGAIRSLVDKRRGHRESAGIIDGLKINDFAAHADDGEPLRV